MKKYFLTVLLFFSWNQSFALSPLECYTQSASEIFMSSTAVIETSTQNFIAVQDGELLPLGSLDFLTRYLNFESNLETVKNESSKYENMFRFSDIDTQITSEILLDTSNIQKNTQYELIFRYTASSHRPIFYISQDGQNYSQVQQADISDFSPQNIKIIFEKIGTQEIREKIQISELSLRKKYFTSFISNIQPSNPVYFYMNNVCEKLTELGELRVPFSADTIRVLNFSPHLAYVTSTTDTDKDGVMDHKDNCKNLYNPDQKDVNQNKVGDVCEFDSDGDSIPDERDTCRNISNTDQKDSDGDGIGNVCDNCSLYNPNQFDVDKNTIGDVCDSAQKYLQENDDDSDGVANEQDNCKKRANPLQEDDDSDGVGNVCDNCKSYQNFDQADTNNNGVGDICEDSDGDGREGLQDNCPNIANPLQEDDDNDGVGNLCEDDDNDKVIFSLDNCPYVYNPDQNNIDSDALGDVCDEQDDRFFESNKTLLIVFMLLVIVSFIGGIYTIARKIQK